MIMMQICMLVQMYGEIFIHMIIIPALGDVALRKIMVMDGKKTDMFYEDPKYDKIMFGNYMSSTLFGGRDAYS